MQNVSLNICQSSNSQKICFLPIKVTEWPPIGKIAAHSAYDMFHGISA